MPYTARNSLGMTQQFATMAEAVAWAKSWWYQVTTNIHDEANNIFIEIKGTK